MRGWENDRHDRLSYGQYLSQALHSAQAAHFDGDVNRTMMRLLTHSRLSDTLTLDEVHAISHDEAVPSPQLAPVFDAFILHHSDAYPEELQRSYKMNLWVAETKEGQRSPFQSKTTPKLVIGKALNSHRCLQALFTLERNMSGLAQEAIAKELKCANSSVSEAETSQTKAYHSFYESRLASIAYAGGFNDRAKRLEKAVHKAFYPNGIDTPEQLIKCVAYKFYGSVQKLGERVGIERLHLKNNPNERLAFNVQDRLALRRAIGSYVSKMQHLDITSELVDRLLPDPLAAEEFKSCLKNWVELACGSKEKFVTLVAEEQGRTLHENFYHKWKLGQSLKPNLDAIVAVLEKQPGSREYFPAYKEDFLVLAQQAIEQTSKERATSHLDRLRQQSGEDSLGLGQRGGRH